MLRNTTQRITARLRARLVRRQRERGRVLAVKWGLNPNSSSLGVDVTFLLFGAAALSLATPVISALIRWRRPAMAGPGDLSGPDSQPSSQEPNSARDRDPGRERSRDGDAADQGD